MAEFNANINPEQIYNNLSPLLSWDDKTTIPMTDIGAGSDNCIDIAKSSSLIIYTEILYLKSNQCVLYDKIKKMETLMESMSAKIDALTDALALMPDSEEVKKQNAETMAKIGVIKLEEVKIAEEQKRISG